jgi:hypothetical protein
LPKGACESRFCFASNVIDWTTILLPGFTTTWTDAFSSHPFKFLVLVFLTAVGLWQGGLLQQRVRDGMRSVWYSVRELNPRPQTLGWTAAPVPPGKIDEGVQRLREHPAYKWAFRLLTRRLMPFAFLCALAYLLTALVSHASFAVRSSMGGVCISGGAAKPVAERTEGELFHTKELCKSTGLMLAKGASYRLRVAIPPGDPWLDDTVAAGPNGVRPKDVSLAMSAGVPFRRHLTLPWFKPMARIGHLGSDEYPLDPDPALASRDSSAGQVFEAEIVARSSGELFLYVNDAVLSVFPGLTSIFYSNNHGSGSVTVELLGPAPATPVGTQ